MLLLGPYPPPHGGVQSNLVSIHELLRKKAFSSQVINITRSRGTEGDGVFYPKSWFQLLILLLRLRYDIIHLHIGGNVTPRLLALSLVCCLMPRRTAVLTFHSGGYPASKEGRSARPWSLRGFVFRRFDRIIGVNREIVELFHRFGVPEERVRLILPHSLPVALTAQALPERLDGFFRSHRPVLLTVGGLEPE
ncbi:MAG: glycosyltransferase, partial [candidate division Zixibacteria bacterium]|nr:glycosyltransferase [candidate division Zixibacteria bacterium]